MPRTQASLIGSGLDAIQIPRIDELQADGVEVSGVAGGQLPVMGQSRSRTASSRLRIVRVAVGLKLPAVLSLLSTLAMGMDEICLKVCWIHARSVPWESPTTGAGLSEIWRSLVVR